MRSEKQLLSSSNGKYKKIRTIGDLSTQMCSPYKEREGMLSPSFCSHNKSKKYSLKDLLSPNKTGYSVDKKKAWK